MKYNVRKTRARTGPTRINHTEIVKSTTTISLSLTIVLFKMYHNDQRIYAMRTCEIKSDQDKWNHTYLMFCYVTKRSINY